MFTTSAFLLLMLNHIIYSFNYFVVTFKLSFFLSWRQTMGFQNRINLGIWVPCSTITSNQAPIPKIDLCLVHIVHKPNTRTFWGTLKICLEIETIIVCVSVNNYSSCCVKLTCQIFYTYISCCVFFFQIYIYMMICNFLPCKCKS